MLKKMLKKIFYLTLLSVGIASGMDREITFTNESPENLQISFVDTNQQQNQNPRQTLSTRLRGYNNQNWYISVPVAGYTYRKLELQGNQPNRDIGVVHIIPQGNGRRQERQITTLLPHHNYIQYNSAQDCYAWQHGRTYRNYREGFSEGLRGKLFYNPIRTSDELRDVQQKNRAFYAGLCTTATVATAAIVGVYKLFACPPSK